MMYKIKNSFGGYINFEKDQVREFTDAEADRYALFVEHIGKKPVNSTDGKPNKEYKKGRQK